jgi:hypothetical protein
MAQSLILDNKSDSYFSKENFNALNKLFWNLTIFASIFYSVTFGFLGNSVDFMIR